MQIRILLRYVQSQNSDLTFIIYSHRHHIRACNGHCPATHSQSQHRMPFCRRHTELPLEIQLSALVAPLDPEIAPEIQKRPLDWLLETNLDVRALTKTAVHIWNDKQHKAKTNPYSRHCFFCVAISIGHIVTIATVSLRYIRDGTRKPGQSTFVPHFYCCAGNQLMY